VATEPETGSAEVDSCQIAYRCWGRPDTPGVVLVHGGAAHAGWWDHIAPLLSDQYRVVALDMSGHGDSGRRPAYSMEAWADEIMAVSAAGAVSGPPVLIGHSMGGWATAVAGIVHSAELAGIVMIDSVVREWQPEEEAARQQTAFGPLRQYATLEDALARFRTVPDQPTSLPWILDRIARGSVRRAGAGWSWKFDPVVFARPRPGPEMLTRISCRVALFRAEHGLVTADIGAEMYERMGRRAPVIEIPLAWHHVMLDQPLPLVTGLRTILADWDHSIPQARPGAGG
jgi:pimeloyl-ACP methyl ester carboxylesterase